MTPLPKYPEGHLFGQKVPKGGSSCSKCRFVSQDGTSCGNTYFQAWRKSLGVEDPKTLPEPADEYCCDVFDAKEGMVVARTKTAIIVKEKGQYCVRSPNNPDWNGGCYDSKSKAEDRLKAVEYFKHKGASDMVIRVLFRYLDQK